MAIFTPPINTSIFASKEDITAWIYQVWTYLQANPILNETTINEFTQKYLNDNLPKQVVTSVNNKKGEVTLNASDVNAVSSVNGKSGNVTLALNDFQLTANDATSGQYIVDYKTSNFFRGDSCISRGLITRMTLRFDKNKPLFNGSIPAGETKIVNLIEPTNFPGILGVSPVFSANILSQNRYPFIYDLNVNYDTNILTLKMTNTGKTAFEQGDNIFVFGLTLFSSAFGVNYLVSTTESESASVSESLSENENGVQK